MPLYNNILSSNADGQRGGDRNAASTSASMKLLQDHLMSKKRSKQQQTKPKSTGQLDRTATDKQPEWNIYDEYDPMVPNSYELLKAESIKAEQQRSLSNSGTVGKIGPKILDVLERLEDDGYLSDRGTSIPAPMSLQSTSQTANTILDSTRSKSDKLDGSVAAIKIMSKMGYKAGQGLGKNEQGISAPLEVDESSGRIVQGRPALSKTESSGATRVLLLQNMVGPGEVDDDLEAETKEECKKYGEVVKCLIYEIPNKLVPDDQAVRIFVEFKQAESTLKASNDLNGRYFGGRVVKATFYDENKFRKFELGP